MLKILRNKKTAKKIWIGLAIIVVPPFVLWGLGGALKSQKEGNFTRGVIYGKKISQLEYTEALNAVRNQAIMQFGEDLSGNEAKLNLEYQAWIRILLLLEAKKRKITVNDKEVMDTIQANPVFQRKGEFDDRAYLDNVRYIFRTQPRAFEEQMRQNLMLSKLYKGITEEVKLTDEEIKKEYKMANVELSIYYIQSNPVDFKKAASPSQDQMKDYFTKNSLSFKVPLSFNVEYACLEMENKVADFMQALSKKEDFAKIAKDLGIAVKETGMFAQTDPVPGIGWSPEIINIISKLKEGQVSEPIKTDKYYILRLKERKEAYVPDLDKIKDKVKDAVIKATSETLAQQKIEDCLKKLTELYKQNPKSADFAQTAKEFGLKFDSTGNFKYGSYIEGIGASDIFWTVAEKLKDDELSDIIKMPTGFYIIKPKAKMAIDEKKFESEKADFSQKLLSQKKQEFFSRFLDDLKRQAQ